MIQKHTKVCIMAALLIAVSFGLIGFNMALDEDADANTMAVFVAVDSEYTGCSITVISGSSTYVVQAGDTQMILADDSTSMTLTASMGSGWKFSYFKDSYDVTYSSNPATIPVKSTTTGNYYIDLYATEGSEELSVSVLNEGPTPTLVSNVSANWTIRTNPTKATLSSSSGTSTTVTPTNYGYITVRAVNSSDSSDYVDTTLNISRVVYNANGGSGAPSATYYVKSGTGNNTITLDTSNPPTYSGHTFKGWGTTSTATSTVTSVTVGYRQTTSVYAVWTTPLTVSIGTAGSTITLTANVRAAWSIIDNPSYASLSSTSAKSTIVSPLNNGYITVRAVNSSDSSDYVDTTLYISRVVYNANGGSGGPSTTYFIQSGTGSHTFTLNTTTIPTYSEHTFKGWGTTSTATTTVSSVSVRYTSSTTVYAVWEQIIMVNVSVLTSDHATVTLTSGGQSQSASHGNTVSLRVVQGSTVKLEAAMDTGYSFNGWASLWGSYISGDNPYLYIANSDLEAENGELRMVVITFDATTNGGVLVGDSQRTYSFNDEYGQLPTATKTAETFLGWFTEATGGTQITATSKMTYTSDTTIYAQFTNDSVEVKAKASDHAKVTITSGQRSETASYGNTATMRVANGSTVTFEAIMDTGYYCPGWETMMGSFVSDRNPYVTTAVDGINIMNGEYPPVVITFDATTNGGVLVGDSQRTYSFDDEYGELPTATKDAELLIGWFTEAMGGTEITPTTKMQFLTDKIIYAQFTNDSVEVTAKASDHAKVTITSGGQSQSASYGNTATMRVAKGSMVTFEAVMDTGYYCPGWETMMASFVSDENPYVTTVTAEIHIMNGEYPPVVITFDATTNGGVLEGDSQRTYSFNDEYGQLPNATKDAELLIGWFTEATGGTEITPTTKMQFLTDKTIYAQFTNDSVEVSAKASDHAKVTITSGQRSETASYGNTATMRVANGSTVTFEAIMDTGYYCPGWETMMASFVSDENPYVTTVTAEIHIMNGEYPPVVITFDAATNGGVLEGDSQRTYSFNDEYGELPSAIRGEDTFLGWYTAASGGTQILPESKMTFIVDTILYAHFGQVSLETVWWDNEYVNGRVDVLFKFDSTTNNYTHRMTIPLWQFNANDVAQNPEDEPADGQWNFDQTAYKLVIDVDYSKTIVTITLMNGSSAVSTETKNMGEWPQFILRIDAQESAITFMGVSKWINNDFTFVNYDVVFTQQIFSYGSTIEELAIKQIYHEDIDNNGGRSTNHSRFQVTETTTWLDTYGFVMVDPSLNIYDQFPDYENIRLNLYSFAMYGETMTLNGWTFNIDGSVISNLYYIEVSEPVLDEDGNLTNKRIEYNMICTPDTEGAIHITPTLQNIYITWEHLKSENESDRICYLTFVDENFSVRLGTYAPGDLRISFTGVWYFTTAVYEPYTSTELSYSMDWNNWFNISADAFILIFIGAIIGITALITSLSGWRLELIDWCVVVGAAIITYILLGGI